MKKLLKIVLSVFVAMALAIQLPVNLVSVVNAENEETNDFELVCTNTNLYLGASANFGYVYINTEAEDYDETYVLSEEGVISQPEQLDDAFYYEAISEGTVTVTAIVTIDDVVVYENSVDITVVDYLDVIADHSIVDSDNSYCYFVYEVLSEEDKTIEIVEYYFDGDEYVAPETINIPSTINGYTVASIGEGAFIGCGDSWTITIPDTVTNIGYWAFIDCYSSTITIPASVTNIANEVFHVKMLNVYSDSYALQYAQDKSLNYTIIDSDSDTEDAEKTFDIDCNGLHASASYSLSELLTDDELNNDSYIEFILSVADVNDTVTDEEKAIIENKLGDYVAIQYLDIDLTKNVDGVLSDVTSTSSKISVIVDLPDTLIETVGDTSGKYVVVRLHDGVAEILEDLDEDANKVTFATDKFSTYAIAFVETTVTTSSTDSTDDTTTTTTTTNSESKTSTVSNVQTGDESQLVAYALVGGIALLGVVCLRKKKI